MSDSETAFRVLKNFRLKLSFCFVVIAFFLVCFFDLIYPISCLCDVITRSYLSFLKNQMWSINV